MNMSETARLIIALQSMGLTEAQVLECILYLETGDESHRPKRLIPEKPEKQK